jgi:hypothetical protein
VAAGGILSLFNLQRLPGGIEPDVLAGFGFCIGVPLLATLSFGNEFQFGTFSSLLSQPIERSRIWREKSVVIVGVVLSTAIAYGFGARRMGWQMQDIAIPGLWLMVTVSSSAFWTLMARSTIGGLVLNGLQSMALVLIWVPQLNKYQADARPQLLLAIVAFSVVYSAVMLYLGRRKLLGFQVTGTAPEVSLLVRDWSPNPIRRLLRCTSSGVTLNLVRKELHFLWPLAPLTLIAVAILLAIIPLRFVFGYEGWIVTTAISTTLIHGILVALLAGVLSLGEERTLGLHVWNMTQPVSVRLQWIVKLVTAVVASAASSGVVILTAYLFFGAAFFRESTFEQDGGMMVLALFPLLTFAALWCATGVYGTIRAAFWCIPAVAAVLAVYDLGMSAGMSRSAVELVRTLTEAVHPFPFSSQFEVFSSNLMAWRRSFVLPALWVTVWLLPVAAIQSYRLFRSEVRGGMRPLIRKTIFLAAVGFVSGFLQIVPAAANGTMHNNTVRALMEIARGVSAMEIDPTAASSEAGYAVSLETLPNAAALSDRTRSWFASDTVTIRPKRSTDNLFDLIQETRYMISAELHGGWKCTFADNLFDGRHGVGAMGVPRSANLLFVCTSKDGKLGSLKGI